MGKALDRMVGFATMSRLAQNYPPGNGQMGNVGQGLSIGDNLGLCARAECRSFFRQHLGLRTATRASEGTDGDRFRRVVPWRDRAPGRY